MNQADIPVMVFDEVDVGIGGGVAEIVGSLLKSLGQLKNRQLFVVTHLAQVAAQSDHHFRVLKKLDAKEINSEIELLSSEERINEVARMIGGKEITLTTLEHAKEILG
jgi:DNA repair protein RecN (Recombination protein N)